MNFKMYSDNVLCQWQRERERESLLNFVNLNIFNCINICTYLLASHIPDTIHDKKIHVQCMKYLDV